MIIDKEKTIKKAIARYDYLFPVHGKHSINDCFFCLRGETFLMFRTKDKKIHRLKAEIIRPAAFSPNSSREALDAIFKALNKPIIVRSLITKRPIRACLIHLFPFPGITWTSNTVGLSDTSGTAELTHSSTNATAVAPEAGVGIFPSAENRQYTLPGSEECSFSDQTCYILRDTTTCKYEILEPGYLPISQFTDMLPTPEETHDNRPMSSRFWPGRQGYESDWLAGRGFHLPDDATTFHYEVLATGNLHKRPRVEWKTISNPCVSGYVHERLPHFSDAEFPQTPVGISPDMLNRI